MADSPSVAITGAGVLASNGLGRRAYWSALEAGESGVRHLDRFDPEPFPCRIAGQLWDFDPADFIPRRDVRRWHRHVHQAVAAARLAVDDAELAAAGYEAERIATGFGTSVGSPNEAWAEELQAFATGGYKRVSRTASSAFSGHAATIHVTVDYGFRGPAITIASGCTTGLDVLLWGVEQIRRGKADAALVGATESPIFPMSFAASCAMGILSQRNDDPEGAMRPYDAGRDGIVLAEGAVALVLEREDRARARGAMILAEVAGMGSAAEGLNPLTLESEGAAMARAITAALADARASPDDIDYIQSHGVALSVYDICETNAFKRALGRRAYRIPVSSVKSMTGQAYAAGGLLGAAGALLALHEGVIPPTLNLESPADGCDLDYVPQRARFNDVSAALTVAMSFGGTHTAAVLRRAK